MNWFILAFKKYAVFSGRSRRKEFWLFHFFLFLLPLTAAVIFRFIGPVFLDLSNTETVLQVKRTIYSLVTLYGLATFLPSVAVTVRRLHDIGKTGWLYLIYFVPYVGVPVILALCLFDSETGTNKYGDNPKDH